MRSRPYDIVSFTKDGKTEIYAKRLTVRNAECGMRIANAECGVRS